MGSSGFPTDCCIKFSLVTLLLETVHVLQQLLWHFPPCPSHEVALSSNLMTATITRYNILLSPQTSSSFGAIRIMCCLGARSSSIDLFWGQEDKEKYLEAVFHVLHCTMFVCILPSQFWFSPSLFGVCKVGVADKNKSLLSTLTIIPNKETGMASDDRESLAPSFACLCHSSHTRYTSVAATRRTKN